MRSFPCLSFMLAGIALAEPQGSTLPGPGSTSPSPQQTALTPAPEHLASAKRLREAMHLESNLRQQSRTATYGILAPMRDHLWMQGSNPYMADDMNAFFATWTGKIENRCIQPSVLEKTTLATAQTFSSAELETLSTFYISPLGKRFSEQIPTILESVLKDDLQPHLDHSNREANKVFMEKLEIETESLPAKRRALVGIVPGSPFPNLNLPCTDGSLFESSKLKGKTILMVFWASAAPQWTDQLSKLRDLHKQYHATGLEIILFNLDFENPADAKLYLGFKSLPWKVIPSYAETAHSACDKIMPDLNTNFLIRADGTLVVMDTPFANLPKAIDETIRSSPTKP